MNPTLVRMFVHECAKEPDLEVLVSVAGETSDATGDKLVHVISKLGFEGSCVVLKDDWQRYERGDEDYNRVGECNAESMAAFYCASLAVEKRQGRVFARNSAPKADLPHDISYAQMVTALALLGNKNNHAVAHEIARAETSDHAVSAELHRFRPVYVASVLSKKGYDRRFVYSAIRAVVEYGIRS